MKIINKKIVMFILLSSLFLLFAGCTLNNEVNQYNNEKMNGSENDNVEVNNDPPNKKEKEEGEVEDESDSELIVHGINLNKYYEDESARNYVYNLIGTEATDFTLLNTEGESATLSDFKGEPVVLEFSHTSCPYCQEVQSEVIAFKEEYKDVTVIQAFSDNSLDEVLQFAEQTGTSLFSELLTGEKPNTTFDDYEVPAVPSFYFINEEGTIEFVHIGMLNEETLKNLSRLVFTLP